MALLSTLRGRALVLPSRLLRWSSTGAFGARQRPSAAATLLLTSFHARSPLPALPALSPAAAAFYSSGHQSHAACGHDHHDAHAAGPKVEASHRTMSMVVSAGELMPIMVLVLHAVLIPSAVLRIPTPIGIPDLMELTMADSMLPIDPLGLISIICFLTPILAVPMIRVRRPNLNIPFLPLRHAIITHWANRLWFDRIYNSFAVYFHASVLGRLTAHIEFGLLSFYPSPRWLRAWAKKPGSGFLK
eukprot:RCo025198